MAKNLLEYEEKFELDIIKRYYARKCRMHYVERNASTYYTDGFVIYRLDGCLLAIDEMCELSDTLARITECSDERNTHKLRYNGMNKDGIHVYLTDSNIEVYINPKLLKCFDKPEKLELWCDGSNRTPVTVKAFGDKIIGYVMPMRMNR